MAKEKKSMRPDWFFRRGDIILLSGRPAVRIRSGTLDTEPKAWFYWVFGFFVLVNLSKSDDRIVSLLTKIQFA